MPGTTGAATTRTPDRAMTVPSPQLPLALRFPPDQRFETFVADDASVLAPLRALASGDVGGMLYVAGAPGTGKTHLLIATCAEAEVGGDSVGYLRLASMAGRLRDALDAMHARSLVALDGVEAITGNRDDELALFDFHNRMHDAGHALLYAATEMPDALSIALPDLRSRLQQCTRIALPVLDDDGRREVLRLRAVRRGLQVDAAAIDWLLRRVDRDLSSLTALLDRLDRAALAAQRRITVPFLRRFFDDAR